MRKIDSCSLFILLLPWLACGVASATPSERSAEERQRRQVSVDDLINTALQFVRPIFDTSQTLAVNQHDPIIHHKKMLADGQNPSNGLRESTILGTPTYSSLRDVPICRGNSQICKFISCTAHNFKHDANLANLNLAVQLIGDKKFREFISKNPETITSVCHEQGLSREQCRIFSRAFQLIDRFISTLESGPTGGMTKSKPAPDDYLTYTNEVQHHPTAPAHHPPLNDDGDDTTGSTTTPANPPRSITTPLRHRVPLTPIRPVNYPHGSLHPQTTPIYTYPLLPPFSGRMGSRTWSTHNASETSGSREQQSSPSPSAPTRVIDTVRRVVNYTTEIGDDSLLARPMSVAPQISTKLLSANSWNLLSRPAPPSTPPRAVLPSSPTLHAGSTSTIHAPFPQPTMLVAVTATTAKRVMTTTLSAIPEAEEEEVGEGGEREDYDLTDLPPTVKDEKKLAQELFKPLLRMRRSTAGDYYDDVVKVTQATDGQSSMEANGEEDAGRGGAGRAHTPKGHFVRLDCLQYMPHLIG